MMFVSLLAVAVIILFLGLKKNYVWFGAWLMWPNVIGNCMLISSVTEYIQKKKCRRDEINNVTRRLHRRLLLRETRRVPGGYYDGSLRTIVFRAGATQSQTVPLENLNVSQEAEHPINQEQWQDLKPAVVRILSK
ncbi:hypothetical protein BDR07DRAFT_938269 [Suillus spraguei]|nr:hypothetical protein BDR07DRAFT_938269 [Suillus spraguei]